MTNVVAWKCQFVKADGSLRDIHFVEMADLPAGFLPPSDKPAARLAAGMRLVWEVGVGVKTYNANAESFPPVPANVKENRLRPAA
jgi:hypothetical protein